MARSGGTGRVGSGSGAIDHAKEQPRWDNLIATRHYLKNASLVGEQLRYVVTDANGHWLALLGWSAAAVRFVTTLAARL